jgi:hypothetical protein
LREGLSAAEGIQIVTYLDPGSGHALAVDVVAQGLERAFDTLPLRWTTGARTPHREDMRDAVAPAAE